MTLKEKINLCIIVIGWISWLLGIAFVVAVLVEFEDLGWAGTCCL
jgi:hypothetical protein